MDDKYLAKSIKSPLCRHEPMRLHTSWKVGGPADVFISLACQEDLAAILQHSRQNHIPLFVFGRGSNLLVRDGGITGIALSISADFAGYSIHGSSIRAQGGVALSRLVKESAQAGLKGLEFAAGIPGTVGGALLMNAGAHGGSMADVFQRAGCITFAGEERLLEPEDLGFAYRATRLIGQDIVITWVELDLRPGDANHIKETVRSNLKDRREKQPREASAGSVFKNPPQGPAGLFIEKAGLKGMQIGGARVSEKHANFIVNTGHAQAKDILALMQKVVEEVYGKFGITLKPEVRIIGQ